MKTLFAAVALATVLGLGVMGCESSSHMSTAEADHSCAACEAGKAGGTVWCEGCDHGFVSGKKTECKGCVTAAEAGETCAACTGKK